MTDRAELDALSSKQLHDRAVGRAERHIDVKFFYDLLRTIPAAAAATGGEEGEDRSTGDVLHMVALVRDLFGADEGELADSLRPFYIDYLLEHADDDRPEGSGAATA